MKILNILEKLAILLAALVIGAFVGNYKWGHKTTERYCHRCGETEIFEEEKSMFHLHGKTSNQLFSYDHFLSAYMDENFTCNHRWNSYHRFPVILTRSGEDALKDRLSSIYWYKWIDLNKSNDFRNLIDNMGKSNMPKTKEFLQTVFDPNKLIAIEDLMPLFELDIPWQEKWERWESFKANYKVDKRGEFMQAIFQSSDSTQIFTWDFRGGSYRKTPVEWKK